MAPNRIRRRALPDPAAEASRAYPGRHGYRTLRPRPAGHRRRTPPPPGPDVGSAPAGQPAAWNDTGKLPAAADDDPHGSQPGLVEVSAPEACRLTRLATQPTTNAARQLGYAWSRWRRRHPGVPVGTTTMPDS